MTVKDIIKKKESKQVWDSAKHHYAELLLQTENTEDHRNYLWNKFVSTGDYFYASLVKLYG